MAKIKRDKIVKVYQYYKDVGAAQIPIKFDDDHNVFFVKTSDPCELDDSANSNACIQRATRSRCCCRADRSTPVPAW